MNETLTRLAQTRDEFLLQAHLFKAEARDRWHDLEHRWHRFTSELDREAGATDDSDENVSAFLRDLSDEIESGYAEFRDFIKDPLP